MSLRGSYSIDDSTGSTVQIAKYYARNQLILQNASGDNVYIAFNEDATTGGIFLAEGDSWVLVDELAKADVYMVCATGESATVVSQASN